VQVFATMCGRVCRSGEAFDTKLVGGTNTVRNMWVFMNPVAVSSLCIFHKVADHHPRCKDYIGR
jgi:hypothetical protein